MLLRETGRIQDEAAAVSAGDRIERAVRAVCPSFEGKPMDRLSMGTQEVADRVIESL